MPPVTRSQGKRKQSPGLLPPLPPSKKAKGAPKDAKDVVKKAGAKRKVAAEPAGESKGKEPAVGEPKPATEAIVLDFDHSYVGEIKPSPPRKKGKRHERWRHEGPESLDDTKRLPTGWKDTEPDLSDDDWDAQIERCLERIEDNILVRRFESKLETLREEKADQDALVASEPAGLSWPVIQRLQSLKRTHGNLAEEDPYVQLPNVEAVMKAYRSGKLTWNPGLITYWCDGEQICEPRPLKWEEFDQVKKDRPGEDRSFWIEGLHGTKSIGLFPTFKLDCDKWFMHYSEIGIRLPGTDLELTINVMDDSGSSVLTIYEGDVKDLISPRPDKIPRSLLLGVCDTDTASGNMTLPFVRMEISFVYEGVEMISWIPIQCALLPGKYKSTRIPRLSGPLLRWLLLTATVPDGKGLMYVSNDVENLIKNLPFDVDPSEASIPDLILQPMSEMGI